MDITLIVGNGFDKALGLKTSYQEFYQWWEKQPASEDDFVNRMKDEVSDKRTTTWADFEVGIGNYVSTFSAKQLAPRLFPWKINIRHELVNYLTGLKTSEQVRELLTSENGIQRSIEFLRSVFWGLRLLNPCFGDKNEKKIKLHLISMNYTDSLDQIAKGIREYPEKSQFLEIDAEVLHPHGTLETGIILGVNDKSQINNEDIKDRFSYLMIKEDIINNEGNENCKTSKEKGIEAIDQSSIICLYGLSLGETDKFWWEKLGKWLQADSKHKLIVFDYITEDNQGTGEKINAIQNVFLGTLSATLSENETKEIKQRIIVYQHTKGSLFSLQTNNKSSTKKKISFDNKVTMWMIFVEAGSFTMSALDGENADSEVSHTVTLTKDFYIGKYEVTQEQWEAVMGRNPSYFRGMKLPVENVSWHQAMAFCEKLNEMGKAPEGYHFTLPTETQWEYAARGGKKSTGCKYSGSNNLKEVGWNYENSGSKTLDESKWSINQLSKNNCMTHPVGKKIPNELGLYDMSGNVCEWCLDDWNKDNNSSFRVFRGGSWNFGSSFCRVAFRSSVAPSYRCNYLGFRVALVSD